MGRRESLVGRVTDQFRRFTIRQSSQSGRNECQPQEADEFGEIWVIDQDFGVAYLGEFAPFQIASLRANGEVLKWGDCLGAVGGAALHNALAAQDITPTVIVRVQTGEVERLYAVCERAGVV